MGIQPTFAQRVGKSKAVVGPLWGEPGQSVVFLDDKGNSILYRRDARYVDRQSVSTEGSSNPGYTLNRPEKEANMQVGIMMFPTRHPVDIAVVARRAEELGFESLWLGEHPIMPVHGTTPFPWHCCG